MFNNFLRSPFINTDKDYIQYINNNKESSNNITRINYHNDILNYYINLDNLLFNNIINSNDVLYYNGEREMFYMIDFFNIKSNCYIISSYGRVFSLLNNRELTNEVNDKGYHRISLYLNDGSRAKFKVHRLVCMAFVLRSQEDNDLCRLQVNHMDKNRGNNFYKNLKWCTNQENNSIYKFF